jgi:serine/threonine protein phosphatase 1
MAFTNLGATMRYLAIGDIHGCFRALTTLIEYVEVTPSDILITLGDYVDRGSNSCAVMDWLIAFNGLQQLRPLRGNHDAMMSQARGNFDARNNWLHCGGSATLRSYSPFDDEGKFVDVPDAHWSFLDNDLLPYFENETHFFVHANVYHNMPLDEQPEHMLYWQKFDDPLPHVSGKTMVCGHTSQSSGVPRSVGHAVCIDTKVYSDGWLTCLDPSTKQYWQANEKGKTRKGFLEQV